MAIVRANEGESADSLIRKFNKKVQQEGILTEIRKREFYEKPSVQRKKQKEASERRIRARADE